MSQRVMLAQQQLQLAQAAPQLHNLREAYRRVYQALDVDNLDALLKPDPGNPSPKSPATENAEAMSGQQPKAFPKQNHPSHIEAHAEFMFTRPVQINPQLYAMMEGHILQHISIFSAEQVEKEMVPQAEEMQKQIQEMQQQAQQNPALQEQVAKQIQGMQEEFLIQKEAQISVVEAKLIKEMAAEETKRSGLEDQDPLIKLKQQEIDLRAAELMQRGEHDDQEMLLKTSVEAEKLDLEREKVNNAAEGTVMKESFGLIKDQAKDTISEIKEDVITLREDRRTRSNEKIASFKERSSNAGKRKDK